MEDPSRDAQGPPHPEGGVAGKGRGRRRKRNNEEEGMEGERGGGPFRQESLRGRAGSIVMSGRNVMTYP